MQPQQHSASYLLQCGLPRIQACVWELLGSWVHHIVCVSEEISRYQLGSTWLTFMPFMRPLYSKNLLSSFPFCPKERKTGEIAERTDTYLSTFSEGVVAISFPESYRRRQDPCSCRHPKLLLLVILGKVTSGIVSFVPVRLRRAPSVSALSALSALAWNLPMEPSDQVHY